MSSSVPDRPYHHGDLKHALVQAGIALIEEGGIPALSLRALAARVGVSHTAPRNHFGSLRGLLTAIAAEGFHRHARAMCEGVSDQSDPQARLMAAMTGLPGSRLRVMPPRPGSKLRSARCCERENTE